MHTMMMTTITPAMVRFLLELKKLIMLITSLKKINILLIYNTNL